jgi:hypothetical protein
LWQQKLNGPVTFCSFARVEIIYVLKLEGALPPKVASPDIL